MPNKAIPWGARVPEAAWLAIMAMYDRLGLAIDNLVTCMMFESGLKPNARNPGSSATGLIQFMDATAARLGTTTTALSKMNFTSQLDYVELYFRGFKQHGWDLSKWTLGDTYMAILWPAAIGKPMDYVMFVDDLRSNHDAFDVNRGLDVNHDGRITKREVCAKIMKLYQDGLKPDNVKVI